MNMKNNRRDFIKTLGLSFGALATSCVSKRDKPGLVPGASESSKGAPVFNMCGYQAPPVRKVRIGIIGLGLRGPSAVERLSMIEGTEIAALCDVRASRVAVGQEILRKHGRPAAKEFKDDENAWKKMCEMKELDLVYICTPWRYHTPMALLSMETGKHAAIEVPAAVTVDECWQLVNTSERTKKHCMMLENTCYDAFELMTLNMARQGVLGEIVHAEGAYIHDLSEKKMRTAEEGGYHDFWRLQQSIKRNGNLYPTHGLGPIAQCMNINRGDKFTYLTSLSSDEFGLSLRAKEEHPEWAGQKFKLGDMNTTMIRTLKGRSILIQHDTSSYRPYSRIHLISGTKGFARKYPFPSRIALQGVGDGDTVKHHEYLTDGQYQKIREKYEHPLYKKLKKIAPKASGTHGNIDFIMDWRLIYCLRNGLALDQDVYDAAAWSVIGPLSEWSVANKSNSIDVPDFTRGTWKNNKPLEIVS